MPTRLSDYVDGLSDAGTLVGTEKLYLASNESTTVDAIRGGLNVTVINLGDWNMDTTANITIAHGLGSSIRAVDIQIIADGSLYLVPLFVGGAYQYDSTDILIIRNSAGEFDGPGYSDTPFNRGYLTIWHA
jgi:hypothetical protein